MNRTAWLILLGILATGAAFTSLTGDVREQLFARQIQLLQLICVNTSTTAAQKALCLDINP